MRAAPRALAMLFVLLPTAAGAQAFASDELSAAIRIYKSAANCEFCHGWHGGGGEEHDDIDGEVIDGGPSLVASTLDRNAMIEIVACGRPGAMPRYLSAAWSAARPCYGMVAADLGDGELPPRGDANLSLRQVESVVDFVRAAYQGDGMSLEMCFAYYSPEQPLCDRFR